MERRRPVQQCKTIVEIGAEGGSITLFGTKTMRGWVFSMKIIDQTLELFGEEPGESSEKNSSSVEGWEAALTLLDQQPWFRLYPVRVHPDFRHRVWSAVRKRLQENTEDAQFSLMRWRELCGPTNAEPLSQ
jgi:hypothetical protein